MVEAHVELEMRGKAYVSARAEGRPMAEHRFPVVAGAVSLTTTGHASPRVRPGSRRHGGVADGEGA